MTAHAQRTRAIHDAGTLLTTLVRYWLTVFPVAHRELARWTIRADAIPDHVRRSHAQYVLNHERLNSEGAALFAMLAPTRHRTSVIRLTVAFQVLYDYLDILTEQRSSAPLNTSRRLHRALTTALGGPPPPNGYYPEEAQGSDGGYLDELVANCRAEIARLPSFQIVMPLALQAAERSAEGQTQSHAAAFTTSAELTRWASSVTPPQTGLQWWETAAASESSLVIHALLASAAEPSLTLAEANRVAASYWPWITGLNALLDDLVDQAEDAADGTHSYIDCYASDDTTATRLTMLAAQATHCLRAAPNSRQHTVILAAMTCFYLSALPAESSHQRAAAPRVRRALDVDTRLLMAVLRFRRLLAART